MSTLESHSDTLNPLQRGGELLIAVALLLMAGFLAIHQFANTGFFTSNFGIFAMILIYTPLLLSIIDALMQVLTGHHNPSRPIEAASGLLLGVAALWFLAVFPFDFTHLADALPEGLRFLLAWVNNDIGKIPLIIQIFVGPITALVAIRAYLANLR